MNKAKATAKKEPRGKNQKVLFRAGAASARAGHPCSPPFLMRRRREDAKIWIDGWTSVSEKQKAYYKGLRDRAAEKAEAEKAAKADKSVIAINPAASDAGRALAAARWAKPDADREQPKRAGLLGGRPKGTTVKGMPRCPCGANTLKRAEARGFDCCKKAGITE